MNRSLIISIGVALATLIIVIGGAVFLSSRTMSGNTADTSGITATGKLTAPETSFDFGTISMAKGKVYHTFKVRDAQADPVVVTRVVTSCMCTKATLKTGEQSFGPFGMEGMGGSVPIIAAVINNNQEAEVVVEFDPAAHGPAGVGRIDRTVTVEQKGKEPLVLAIAAEVTP